MLSEAGGVQRLALLRMHDPINACRFHLESGPLRVSKRTSNPDMPIVDIGTVIGQANVITSRERQWI